MCVQNFMAGEVSEDGCWGGGGGGHGYRGVASIFLCELCIFVWRATFVIRQTVHWQMMDAAANIGYPGICSADHLSDGAN